MANENNEKEIKKPGTEAKAGAAPKKKLNVVFRKQNSSSIKELPKGLMNAAGEGARKKRPAAEKAQQPAEKPSVRRPRPLPEGTKPVKPVLKELEEKNLAAAAAAAQEAAAAAEEAVRSAKAAAKKAAGLAEKAAAPGAEITTPAADVKKEPVQETAPAAEVKNEPVRTPAAEAQPAPEEKPAAKPQTLSEAGTAAAPKVRIVKSYANYNAAEIIAEASRQARKESAAAKTGEDRKGRTDARREGGRGPRQQGQGQNQNQGQGQGRGGQKPGEGGRTFIVRGNAAPGGRGGRPGEGPQGRRPGAGAGMAAPAFDPNAKNAGRGGRGSAGRNDRKDRKDKFVDAPNAKTAKTGKGAFIKPEPKKERPEDEVKSIVIPESLTIKELSDKLKMQPSVIVKKLFLSGKMVTPNTELSYEEAEEIAIEYDILCEKEVQEDVIAELLKEDEENEKDLVTRNPVVCVMGHVDHGKTSLLDAIRNTNVTSREAGGITQHIGASVVKAGDRNITFLDTPGHEAFTAMRLRGAQSTDIAVLVVAADDGVQPQTIEAINHAKAAGVEVVVAINKIDKVGANIEQVKGELTEYDLIAEDYGGSTPMVPVSAKTGEGIPELLDMILLVADVLELKANPNRNARGLVIEAQLDKGRGPVATVLVQKGTLKVGDNVAAGACFGKVRAMLDDKGGRIKKAGPSYPAEILGLNDVPNAGEVFMVCSDEK